MYLTYADRDGFANAGQTPMAFIEKKFIKTARTALVLLVAFTGLLAFSGQAGAGDFCGPRCVISEDFDDAGDGGGVVVGTLPPGWVNVSGENAGDFCVYGATGQFPDPCFDWWVSSGVPAFGNDQAPIQPPFDHTDGLGNFLFVNSDDNGNQFVDLLTPSFPLIEANLPYATFYLYSFDTGSSAPNTLQVDIMNEAGTAVVQAAVFTVGDVGIETWRPAYVDLDGTPDGTFRLRFRWSSTLDQRDEGRLHDIAIDDFAVVADRQPSGAEGGVTLKTHIVPAPEPDILAFLNDAQGSALNPVESYIGLSIALDNVVIYYDESEDGYEPFINNPVQTTFNQTIASPAPTNRSTQIWGDGFPENGFPPGRPDDILSLGDVIVLREPEIDINRLNNVLYHAAGDLIASSGEIAVTRVFWAAGDETLNAGAIELFPTDRWGSNYVVPIGENITAAQMDSATSCGDDDIFEEVALFIQAETDGTGVVVDFNNGGATNDFSTTLNKGESAFVGFNPGADGINDINAGATVTATGGNVQVHVFTIDEGSNFGSRFYTLAPLDQLDSEYFAPFESSTGGDGEMVIFNPNPDTVLVDVFTGANPATPVSTLSIAAGGFDTFVLPFGTASGASVATRVQSRGGATIYPVVVMDACDDAHDWGAALLPAGILTQAILIPVGFGNDPTGDLAGNHSPLWVTPVADTFIYVDFDGDLVPDLVDLNGDGDTNDVVDGINEATSNQGMAVNALQLLRVHNPNEDDQSGALMFSLASGGFAGPDPTGIARGAVLAGGWGQDPDTAGGGATPTGSPAIDVGTAFAPITFPSTLPVSISSFETRPVAGGLEVEWTTVSETHNAGYFLWGDRGQGTQLLTQQPIAAIEGDAVEPRRYRVVLPGVAAGELTDLAVAAVDLQGREEIYGLFDEGQAYGKPGSSAPIEWREIKRQADARQAERRAAVAPGAGFARSSDKPFAVHVRASGHGLQRLTWDDLERAGLDLNGVPVDRIAVTLNGRPVARDIVTDVHTLAQTRIVGDSGPRFSRQSSIRFWAEKPMLPDALYLDEYVYRISVEPEMVRQAGTIDARPQAGFADYTAWIHQNDAAAYDFASPLADPWYAARLRADTTGSYETVFTLDDELLVNQPGELKIVLGGLTDFPQDPDHRAQVEVNGVTVGEYSFNGQEIVQLDLDIPAGTLSAGDNTVRILAPGGTGAMFDIFLVDTVSLGYRRGLAARGDRLLIEQLDGSARGLTATGFTTSDTAAYARVGEDLVRLPRKQFSRGSLQVPTIESAAELPEAQYWLSSVEAIQRPIVVDAPAPMDLLEDVDSNLLVVAHPAFMPVSETESHPLNDYLQRRRAEGWKPQVFDITDIQRSFGYGNALPGALTAFLREADKRLDYEHVLLVGGDSYDYNDELGLGSISFIPTRYAPTRSIRHTPSDPLLADLDGDGMADKALGRWPVRTIDDLRSIVAKTLDWDNVAGNASASGAVWVTDSEDTNLPSFREQASRMIEPLQFAGWPAENLDRVYFDEVVPQGNLSLADSARAELFESIEQGRAITGFVGHGAPAMWTFQGLLSPDDLTELDNVGKPTLITTMTCYTSYFVSPFNDTVAHRWMNGYREDASGGVIPGVANGAVAIHGAAALSSYGHNERVARDVLNEQLAGATLGQAIERARMRARMMGFDDQIVNWTLLGDPTLKLQ